MKIIFLSFDDAKVRRFLQSAMDYTLFLHKKRISFDVNQLIVCEHTTFVCENNQKGNLFINFIWRKADNCLFLQKICRFMKYPIGIQDFKTIRTDGYFYADKTALMYKMIKGGQYYFLSRPRRFGKSLLISMM